MESNVKYQAKRAEHGGVRELQRFAMPPIITTPATLRYISIYVDPGERLPYVPYFDWSGNVRYDKPLKDALHWYGQYDLAHKGDMFNAAGDRQQRPALRAAAGLHPHEHPLRTRAADEHWPAELYITNLTNKNAVIYTNEGNYDLRQTVNEPRVFGMRLSYRFGKSTPGGGE